MQFKLVKDEGLGAKPPAASDFMILWQKVAILSFNAILVTFCTFFKPYD